MLEWLEMHQLPCIFKGIFGIDCPGCGFQRAVLLLLKGDIGGSVSTWPALIPLLFFMMLSAARISGMKKISAEYLKNAGFVCLIIILISYLLRLIVNTY